MTTRRRDSAVIRPHSQLVPVGMSTHEESVDYLGARLPQGHAREEELGALARALGHFPLALSQAAAFVIDTGMSLTTYCELLDDQRETLTDLLPATSPADEHGGTVAGALQLALGRAQDLAPAGSARAALELLSMLAPDGVPEAVPHTTAARRWIDAGAEGAEGAESSGSVPDRRAKRAALLSLRALHRLSLVTHDVSCMPASVEVHALVQRAVREAVPRQARLLLAGAAADALEELWSSTAESDTQPETEAALYRSVDVLRRTTATDLLWDGRMHPVLRRIAPHLAGLGRDGAARDVCQELLEQARTRLGEGHRDVLVLRCQIALATGELEEAASAQVLLRDIRQEAECTLGATDPDTLAVRLHEARFLMEAGAVTAALDRFTGLAEQLAEEFGDHHALVVDARGYMALCRCLSGDAVGARDGTAAFLALLEQRLGAEHGSAVGGAPEEQRDSGAKATAASGRRVP